MLFFQKTFHGLDFRGTKMTERVESGIISYVGKIPRKVRGFHKSPRDIGPLKKVGKTRMRRAKSTQNNFTVCFSLSE